MDGGLEAQHNTGNSDNRTGPSIPDGGRLVRALVAAVLAASSLVPAPYAHADAYTLSATCSSVLYTPVQGSVVGWAEAGGDVRPVSTRVVCTLIYRHQDVETFEAQYPGAVAVVASPARSDFLYGPPIVCAGASAYWADGHTASTGPTCVSR